MIRHVFKLVWNRKRSTGLILVEILACFLVLCGILATGLHLAIEWSKPLGFDYENVWAVEISGMGFEPDDNLAADRQALADMLRAVGGLTEVESAAMASNTPFSGSTWMEGTWIGGKSVSILATLATQDLPRVLHMDLLYGRWVDPGDAAFTYQPVVVTRNLARDMFGTENPVGRDVPIFDEKGQPKESKEEGKVYRVVGVMDDYRRNGMLEPTQYSYFFAVDFENGKSKPNEMLLRVRPGTTAAFEERLVRTLQSISPQWTYDTTQLRDRRHDRILGYVTPLILSAIVAVFLIVMVGLGLVGVLWLGVTRRTSELGLRRAMGASAVSVRRQVLGELWALTAIAVGVGSVIFLQFPLFGANFGAGWPVFLGGAALATLVVYLFVTVCGLYPAWLATRVQPATALQYE